MKKSLIIGFAIVLLGAITAWFYINKESSDSVISQKADIEINAAELLLNFETNENDANALYLNKVIQLTGIVSEIDELETGVSVYLKEANTDSGILCGFSKKAFNTKSVQVGDSVIIKGLCTGYLFDVVLNKCAWKK
jgi:hypothetical protein